MREFDEPVRQIVDDIGLSGVVRVDVEGVTVAAVAAGLAHRAVSVPNTVDTQFGLASGTKGFTAVTVMRLVERGDLTLDTTARSILGDELPAIDPGVTIEHLLAHRSGIGDYLDEGEIDDWTAYTMPVPVQFVVDTSDYLPALDGHPTKFPPGARFEYCNGAFVVLALLAERVTGLGFHELVEQSVFRPAGMVDTAFLRSDALPGRAALGYLYDDEPDGDGDRLRTNVFHLPIRGSGDGGVYSTAADLLAFWQALFDGRLVAARTLNDMVTSRGDVPDEGTRYGLGLWLDASTDVVSIHGFDTGVGFVSVHDPDRRSTYTVLSNQSRGAWPCSERIGELLRR
jgi:CubicO group peptidase (beta-lactamase class C family)